MQEHMVAAKQWQADFAAAGGRTVYLVARMGKEGGGPVGSQLNLVVVPLEAGADTKKLTELIKYPLGLDRPAAPGIAPPPNPPQKNPLADLKGKTVGKALVVSDPDTIDALDKLIAPAPRPDLDKALAAAGGGTVQVAVVPSDALRATAAFLLPKLPPELGGGPSTPISQGIQWIALGIDAPPNGTVRLTIQAKDADAARKLHDLIETGFRSMRAQPGFPQDASVEKSLAALTPQVAGDQLKLTLDTPKVTELAKGLAPFLERQRESAKQVASMNHLRQLALAVIMYSQDHKGQLPRKYPDDLKPYLQGDFDAIQINPRRPDRRPGYIYVRPAETLSKVANVQEAILFYEAHDPKEWRRDDHASGCIGIDVAFADGHCELVQDRETFERMLKASSTPADGGANPPGAPAKP
jgi:hypothetical protein